MFFIKKPKRKNFQCIFIVRHAEKHSSNSLEDGMSVSLTLKGQATAKQFGKKLLGCYGELQAVKSSPVKRCVKTAKLIMESHKLRDRELVLSNKLGAPGSFVSNDKIAGKHFVELGVKGVVKKQLAKQSLEGIRDIDEAVAILLQDIMQDLECADKPMLYVTHDAILAPLAWWLIEHKPDDDEWFGFLDGVAIVKSEDNVFLIWNKKEINITDRVSELLSLNELSIGNKNV